MPSRPKQTHIKQSNTGMTTGMSTVTCAALVFVAAVLASAATVILLNGKERPPLPLPRETHGDFIQHLFSTPLYHTNIADKADMGDLASLGLDGYHAVIEDKSLTKAIRDHKASEICPPAPHPHNVECNTILDDIKQFHHHHQFFHWQMHHGEKNMPIWGDFPPSMIFRTHRDASSPNIRNLVSHIRNTALPRYMKAMGVPRRHIPTFVIQMWAAVATENHHTHETHMHFSEGECICSGVLYAQAPPGSAPLSFSDLRQPHDQIPTGYFPSNSYDYTPVTGDLLLFPPWTPHQVKESRFNPDGTSEPMARVVWAFNVLTLRGVRLPDDVDPPPKPGAGGRLTKNLHNLIMNVTA